MSDHQTMSDAEWEATAIPPVGSDPSPPDSGLDPDAFVPADLPTGPLSNNGPHASTEVAPQGASPLETFSDKVTRLDIGLMVDASITTDEMMAAAQYFHALTVGSPWWYGDLLAYANSLGAAGDELYLQIAEVRGLGPNALSNMVTTCERFPLEHRRPDVPFTQHETLSAIESQQDRLAMLERCDREGWSAKDTYDELRAYRARLAAVDVDPGADVGDVAPVEVDDDPTPTQSYMGEVHAIRLTAKVPAQHRQQADLVTGPIVKAWSEALKNRGVLDAAVEDLDELTVDDLARGISGLDPEDRESLIARLTGG